MDCSIWYDERVPMHWPQLRYLCICHMEYYEEESLFDPALHEDLLLPSGFLSCESTPNLERLHLQNCALRGVSQITGLSKLKELRISGNRFWSVSQLVEILQSLCHLKRLSLDNFIAEPDPVADVLGVQNNGNLDQMLTMELEEFFLRDDYRLCVQFFGHITFTASRIFQLLCHNVVGTYNAKDCFLFLRRRITPIIHNLLKTDPSFSNCVLNISNDVMKCLGLPDNFALDKVRWPWRMGYGGSFFDGTHIEVRFEHQNQCDTMVKEWLHPIFSNVVEFDFVDTDDIAFKDDCWLSELLRKSNHRLKAIHGTTSNAWRIILRNMFPELHGFKPPCLPDIPFLSELEELGMYISHTPDDYPLYQTIFDFCHRKSEMGRPLLRFEDPPPLWEAQSDPDRVAFITQLKELGIQVIDNFGHRGLRMLVDGE